MLATGLGPHLPRRHPLVAVPCVLAGQHHHDPGHHLAVPTGASVSSFPAAHSAQIAGPRCPGMPTPQQSSVLLHLSLGMTVDQVGSRLCKSAGTIRSLLHRAQATLQAQSRYQALGWAAVLGILDEAGAGSVTARDCPWERPAERDLPAIRLLVGGLLVPGIAEALGLDQQSVAAQLERGRLASGASNLEQAVPRWVVGGHVRLRAVSAWLPDCTWDQIDPHEAVRWLTSGAASASPPPTRKTAPDAAPSLTRAAPAGGRHPWPPAGPGADTLPTRVTMRQAR